MRTLQNENHKLYHQVRTFEEYKQTEINNVKDLYDKQVGLNTSEKNLILLLKNPFTHKEKLPHKSCSKTKVFHTNISYILFIEKRIL